MAQKNLSTKRSRLIESRPVIAKGVERRKHAVGS